MTTTIVNPTYQNVLNGSEPGDIPTVLSKMLLGNMLQSVKVVFTGLTSSATQNIATAAAAAAATVTGITLPTNGTLPKIRTIRSCRVTAGTATGDRYPTDSGGTPVAPSAGLPGIVAVSDDGTTLTFEAAVTAFVLTYEPQSALDLTSSYP